MMKYSCYFGVDMQVQPFMTCTDIAVAIESKSGNFQGSDRRVNVNSTQWLR